MGYFWALLKFQIFFRVLEIPDILGVRVDAGPEPTYEEKLRVPPPLGYSQGLKVISHRL